MSESKMVPRYGCHCDIELMPSGWRPDACVFDENRVSDCTIAVQLQRDGQGRNDCKYWRPIKINEGGQDAAPDGRRVVAAPVPPSPDNLALAARIAATPDTRTEEQIITDGVRFVMGPGGDEGTRAVTHENDNCYLLNTQAGTLRLERAAPTINEPTRDALAELVESYDEYIKAAPPLDAPCPKAWSRWQRAWVAARAALTSAPTINEGGQDAATPRPTVGNRQPVPPSPDVLLMARLRSVDHSAPHDELCADAADAIERLTAERDALRADRDSWRDQASDRVDDALKFANEADALRAERDALRAANLDCVAHYEDARADAERWQRLMLLWAASTELTLAQTDDGRWSITQVEAVDEPFPQLVGDTPTAAIDAARGKG